MIPVSQRASSPAPGRRLGIYDTSYEAMIHLGHQTSLSLLACRRFSLSGFISYRHQAPLQLPPPTSQIPFLPIGTPYLCATPYTLCSQALLKLPSNLQPPGSILSQPSSTSAPPPTIFCIIFYLPPPIHFPLVSLLNSF